MKSNALAERITPTTAKMSKLNEAGVILERSWGDPSATRESIEAMGQVIKRNNPER
jgi:hypothetical protein